MMMWPIHCDATTPSKPPAVVRIKASSSHRCRRCDALAQTADDEQHADIGERIDVRGCGGIRQQWSDRHPEISAARKIEGGRHHADNRGGLLESHHRADRGRLSAELIDPDTVAEDDNGRRGRLVVLRPERASKGWTDAQPGHRKRMQQDGIDGFEDRGVSAQRQSEDQDG
jgi:hypothetical protein